MSGAQWSAERLRHLADSTMRVELSDALRAFARVVSAWQEYESATDDAPGQSRDNLVHALSDALDAGRGDA